MRESAIRAYGGALTIWGVDDDRRDTPSGGRRTYDPPAVGLREHLEMLIRGIRTELHLEVTTVSAKVDEFRAQNTKEHAETKAALGDVTLAVQALESSEDRREGGRATLSHGWVVFTALIMIALSAASIVLSVVAS